MWSHGRIVYQTRSGSEASMIRPGEGPTAGSIQGSEPVELYVPHHGHIRSYPTQNPAWHPDGPKATVTPYAGF